jgi:hypothetical protein
VSADGGLVRVQVTSLRRLLENDIADHIAKITELSDAASRELSIEKAMDKMQVQHSAALCSSWLSHHMLPLLHPCCLHCTHGSAQRGRSSEQQHYRTQHQHQHGVHKPQNIVRCKRLQTHAPQGDWEGLVFELGPWKETGTFILKGGPVEEAQTLLDDHIVKSQAMAASPFAKPFEERLVPWERKLVRFQVRRPGPWEAALHGNRSDANADDMVQPFVHCPTTAY